MNSITLTGRFGKDPELKPLKDSTKKLCVVSIAENQGSKEHAKTQWYTAQFWGDSAERMMQWAKKGMAATLFGRLKVDEWEDNTGAKRTNLIINVDQFQLAQPAVQPHGDVAANGTVVVPEAPLQSQTPIVSDDEIPF